jgi:hypothetical protein
VLVGLGYSTSSGRLRTRILIYDKGVSLARLW